MKVMGYNKWIGFVVAGILILIACQREEAEAPVPGYSTEAIAFTSPYMTTRSTEMRYGSFETGDEVGVLGYCWAENGDIDVSSSQWDTKKVFAMPDMFYNEWLTYTEEGLWKYDGYRQRQGDRYVDMEGICPWYENADYTYAFFAYYPYAGLDRSNRGTILAEDGTSMGTIELSGEEDRSDPTITYTMPYDGLAEDASRDWRLVPDFMLAYKVNHRKSDGPVDLKFRHLLCALEFEINNFNPKPVSITQLAFSGKNFYKSVSVTGQENGYHIGEERYSGNFNIISNAIEIGGAEVNAEGEVTAPKTMRLEADKAGSIIDLLFITDELGKITDADGSCSILITANMEGEQIGDNRHMPIDSEMSFRAGVRSIFSINIVGNDFILQIRSDDNWEDGGDSDIVFE